MWWYMPKILWGGVILVFVYRMWIFLHSGNVIVLHLCVNKKKKKDTEMLNVYICVNTKRWSFHALTDYFARIYVFTVGKYLLFVIVFQ